MSLRILALLADAFGGTGGISQYNRDLICAWSTLDAVEKVVVLPRHASPSQPSLPDKVEQLSSLGGPLLYSVRAIARSFRRDGFNLIFCGHLHLIPLAVVVSKHQSGCSSMVSKRGNVVPGSLDGVWKR